MGMKYIHSLSTIKFVGKNRLTRSVPKGSAGKLCMFNVVHTEMQTSRWTGWAYPLYFVIDTEHVSPVLPFSGIAGIKNRNRKASRNTGQRG